MSMTRMHFQVLAGLLGPLLCMGCAGPKAHRSARVFAEKPLSVQTGKASWYGGQWVGRKTANGERYQPGDLTAAHRSLPFDSMVRVTNLRNGRSTIVRINNRGPYVRGRILDVSAVAARRLDMCGAGVIPVRMEVLQPMVAREVALAYVQGQGGALTQ
jgi:rare lipoprotein A